MGAFDDPVSEARHHAIWNYIRSCSLPVFRATDQQQVPVGTGTLLDICGRSYLATASHVARLGDGGRLAVPIDRACTAVTTLGHSPVVRALHDEHDVAIAVLEDPVVLGMLRRHWTFLPLDGLGTPWYRGPFLIYGYLQPENPRPGPNGPGKTVGLILSKYDGRVDATADPLDDRNDMLLEWPAHPITLDGERVTPPRLYGVSGASVWALEPGLSGADDNWTPAKHLKLVGIQSGAKQGEYVRAKRWHMLWSAFGEIDKATADAVRSTLEAHRARFERPEQGPRLSGGP